MYGKEILFWIIFSKLNYPIEKVENFEILERPSRGQNRLLSNNDSYQNWIPFLKNTKIRRSVKFKQYSHLSPQKILGIQKT